jgi:hypothetical protein
MNRGIFYLPSGTLLIPIDRPLILLPLPNEISKHGHDATFSCGCLWFYYRYAVEMRSMGTIQQHLQVRKHGVESASLHYTEVADEEQTSQRGYYSIFHGNHTTNASKNRIGSQEIEHILS